ncbi:MAG: hypothetical protein II234_03050 [Clostridia bacterium]|nr:hypothetical protein [Clostridia bacterium]
MYVSQVIMASLPNIEIVSLFIILITRKFGIRSLYSVYIFVACEVFTYGISMWVINYFYVWTILWVVVFILRKIDDVWVYSIISALFGILFGTFCSIPYFIIGGISGGLAYIVSGFWFDILHCVGNFIVAIVLYKPLTRVMNNIQLNL